MTTERLDVSVTTRVTGEAVGAAPEGSATDRVSWLESVREHRRTWMAIRGFREVILIASVYSLYDFTRYLVAGDHDGALRHGAKLLQWEKDVSLAPEHWLNKVVSAHIALGLPADYMYATLHYLVTPAVLIWMWRRHQLAYPFTRTILMIATIIGLIGFTTLPTGPPRLLPGFIDTMTKFSHYGWWSNAASAPRGLAADTNQYAAFPSLHVGWALWCGWQLFRYGRHRITKALGVLYPILLSVDVMATANHYFFDVVAGVIVVLIAAGITHVLARFGLLLTPKQAAARAAPPTVTQRAPA